jgi:hypothetical protein
MLSPIICFVYNRLGHTRKTIAHLKKNALAIESDLFIFSDGGRDKKSWRKVTVLRNYLHTISGFKSVTIIERETNYYLERNIIEGVTQIINKYGRVIVVEDDVCVNPYFLHYMNDALNLYENKTNVMHISSINHFDIQSQDDANFTSLMECGWGWATWKNRWHYFKHFQSKEESLDGLSKEDLNNLEYNGRLQCLKSVEKKPIPWDICWAIAIYKNKGLCMEPVKPMATNIGLYGGTHYNNSRIWGKNRYDRPYSLFKVNRFPEKIALNQELEHLLFNHFEGFGIKFNMLGRCVRQLYKLIK